MTSFNGRAGQEVSSRKRRFSRSCSLRRSSSEAVENARAVAASTSREIVAVAMIHAVEGIGAEYCLSLPGPPLTASLYQGRVDSPSRLRQLVRPFHFVLHF